MQNQSRGLGDEIAKLTKVTRIDWVVKESVKVVGKVIGQELDCGCEKRQEMLNELVPFKSNK